MLIQFVLFALIAAGPRNWPGWTLPGSAWTTACGWALFVSGIVVGLLAVLRFGTRLTPLPYPSDGAPLLQTGVYRYVRHPMYLAAISGSFGWGLVREGWLILVYAALLFLLFDRKSRREEAWLQERHPEYAAYRKRTRRLIPFLY